MAMQTTPFAMAKEGCNLLVKKDQVLRRAYSDTSSIIEEALMKDTSDFSSMKTISEVENAECECCGMSEECTPTYIGRIKGFFCGKWVCGLCSEAVKERMKRSPSSTMEVALESHTALCKQFNGTTRLNPKLTLAGAMRDIARKSSQHRSNAKDHCGLPRIGRTMSCVPRIDGC